MKYTQQVYTFVFILYGMPRYTVKTTICDALPVYVRKLSPHDKEFIRLGFESLSFRSKCLRFISPPKKLSEKWIHYLTNIDQINHVALIAFGVIKKQKVGIGVARYVRLQEDPQIAEIAITIHDKFHNQGIGTLLLSLLIKHALQNNIHTLRGYVLKDNNPMLHILKKYQIKKYNEDGRTLKIDIIL